MPTLDIANYLGIGYGNSPFMSSDDIDLLLNQIEFKTKHVKFKTLEWGSVEYAPPIKILFWSFERMNWAQMDKLFLQWQNKGFSIHAVISCKCSWGTAPTVPLPPEMATAEATGAAPPTAAYEERFLNFIKQFALRYCTVDTSSSLPGLRAPLLAVEWLSEANSEMFFRGTKERYIDLLYKIKNIFSSVNPLVKIILSGINFSDFMEDYSSADVAIARSQSDKFSKGWQNNFKRQLEFFDFMVKNIDAYDVIDLHSMHGYESILMAMDYLRQITNKAIWVGDGLCSPHMSEWPTDYFPVPDEMKNLLNVLNSSPTGSTERANADLKLSQLQLNLSIKKLAIAAASGARKFILETIDNFPWYSTIRYSNLVDDFRNEDGTRIIWTPRACLRNYNWLQELFNKLGKGFCSYVNISTTDKIFSIKFSNWQNEFVYITWSENTTREENIYIPNYEQYLIEAKQINYGKIELRRRSEPDWFVCYPAIHSSNPVIIYGFKSKV